jgi:hypothetical protein
MEKQLAFNFKGSDFVPAIDQKRLETQFDKILKLMSDGKFRTLQEIYNVTGFSQASISAQLRASRKQSFGGHTMNKRRRSEMSGTWEYQIVLKK